MNSIALLCWKACKTHLGMKIHPQWDKVNYCMLPQGYASFAMKYRTQALDIYMSTKIKKHQWGRRNPSASRVKTDKAATHSSILFASDLTCNMHYKDTKTPRHLVFLFSLNCEARKRDVGQMGKKALLTSTEQPNSIFSIWIISQR